MTDLTHVNPTEPEAPSAPPSAGAALRAAREAHGLSIDDVAQQLKLAPRQVQALELDEYAQLPGRTFVRGFVRNYARFIGLDPEAVVGLLPGSDVAPALERPTITPSGRPMGELPADTPKRRAWARWTIPLVLVAIVAAAGVYEFRRPQAESPRTVTEPAPAASTSGAAGTSTSTLPNPLAGDVRPGDPATGVDNGSAGAGTSAPASSAPATGGPTSSAPTTGGPASSAPTTGGPATNLPASVPPTSSAPPGSATATSAATSSAAPAASATTSPAGLAATAPAGATATPSAAATPAAPGEPLLVLTFKGSSWVQVKDRNGNVVIAQTGQPGTTQAVSGPLPLDVVVGNAREVSATFRGQPVDLAPHVRANVARLSLK